MIRTLSPGSSFESLCSRANCLSARLLFSSVVVLFVIHASGATITNGLVVYLNFDNNFAAQAGTTNNGSVYTGGAVNPARYVTGRIGSAVTFTNAAVDNGQPTDWAITLGSLERYYSNSYSVSLWVRTTNGPVDGAFIGNKNWTSGANVGWVISSFTVKNVNWNTVGGTRTDVNLSSAFSDGIWHLVTVTFDRETNQVKTYLDGALANIGHFTPDGKASLNAGFPTLIGSSGSGADSGRGDVDDLGIWSRVLTPTEVAEIFVKGQAGEGLTTVAAPTIITSPQNLSVFAGGSALFQVTAAGSSPLSYQWQKDDGKIAGATNASFAIAGVTTNDVGSYRVGVTNEVGGVISTAATLTVTAAPALLTNVQHIVVFMQENRSFDHYFGSLKGVRGFDDRSALMFPNGNTDFYQPDGSGGFVLPFGPAPHCLSDMDHSWGNTHGAWNAGKWDRWVPQKGVATMSYYPREELPYYYALADAYTICDNYFCSVLASSNPNRLYLWTGMIDPAGTGGGPVIDASESGYTWTTYPERLQSAGVSWKIYQQSDNYDDNALDWFTQYRTAGPGNPLYDRGLATVPDLVGALQSDVTNGTLPRVSWIIAPADFSEHPPWSPENGALLTKQFLDALALDPATLNSTVFILTYDENDGIFDHVIPPTPPPGTPDEFVAGLPIGLGVRVPTIIVSPWTRGGYVCSQVFDHTSIIRFLEVCTGVFEPNISAWRRQLCGDLASAFDFPSFNTNYPSLPEVTGVTCDTSTKPVPPAVQSMPIQEAGAMPARPLPYQPDATSFTDCGVGRFLIKMINAGSASVHFAIYPDAHRNDGPWQYDVAANNSVTDSFDVVTYGGGLYDLTCYGPNGFQRRFAGNIYTSCDELEVTSSIDANDGSIRLTLRNDTAAAVTFKITNGYPATGGPWTYNLAANETIAHIFPARTVNGGWYNLTASVIADPAFVRRFAGHIEPAPLNPSDPSAPASITSFAHLPSGSFALSGTGATNQTYVLLSATNLVPPVSWARFATNNSDGGGGFSFTNLPPASEHQRFYRVLLGP